MAWACPQIGPELHNKERSETDPLEKRKQALPKTLWWQAVTAELTEMALTWREAQHVAQDRTRTVSLNRIKLHHISKTHRYQSPKGACFFPNWSINHMNNKSKNVLQS